MTQMLNVCLTGEQASITVDAGKAMMGMDIGVNSQVIISH